MINVRALCVQLNAWLMAFNLLLPAYPLDGGRILVDLLLLCRVPVKPTAIVTVALAVCVAVLLVVWGFVRFAVLTIAVSFPPKDLKADIALTYIAPNAYHGTDWAYKSWSQGSMF